MKPLLDAHGVSRRFGYRKIFNDISLSLGRGEVLALVGPNGAGKTTLLRVLAGLLKPTTGTVERHGTVGLVAHHSMGYDALTARENLAFAARLWGISDGDRIDHLLEQIGLAKWGEMRSANFSRGMTQRLAIARALIHDPDILLLDEPLNSLDEPGTQVVLDVIEELAGRDRALAVVTHQFERMASVATSVGYLVGGTLVGPEPVDGREAEAVSQKYRSLLASA
jgi:heme exporter protein A